MPRRPAAIAFDVIETLFPIEPLGAGLEAMGLPRALLPGWFAASLRDGFSLAAIGQFQPLRAVMEANLDDLLARHGRSAPAAEKAEFLDGMGRLPPHPEAAEAVALLAGAGLPLVALSNGGTEATEALLRGAGFRDRFARVVTTAEIGLSKPRREVYHGAAERAGVEPARLMLVAVHPWDTNGAKAAGLMAGFVARGRPYPAVMTPPDLRAETLPELARAILTLG